MVAGRGGCLHASSAAPKGESELLSAQGVSFLLVCSNVSTPFDPAGTPNSRAGVCQGYCAAGRACIPSAATEQ